LVPYGAPPPPAWPTEDPRDQDPNRPLRLLFAGALSQRKGLAEVFAALRLLHCPREIELVLLGQPCAPMEFYRAQKVPFTYEPPRANEAVLALMATCDALVLPSLVEGRAIVQLEALSRGLPLLVTRNAGGEDLITPGETGFLVPNRGKNFLAAGSPGRVAGDAGGLPRPRGENLLGGLSAKFARGAVRSQGLTAQVIYSLVKCNAPRKLIFCARWPSCSSSAATWNPGPRARATSGAGCPKCGRAVAGRAWIYSLSSADFWYPGFFSANIKTREPFP
jgi:hypothetical protein